MLLSLFDAQPTDIWHDTLFLTVLSISATLLAGFIAAIAAYLIYRRQRNKKEISYQVISEAPIANINEDVEDKVEIRFDGERVEDASLLILELRNSGNTSIRPEDYIEPIRFEFEGRKLLRAEVLSMKPEDLINPEDFETFITLEDGEIEVENVIYVYETVDAIPKPPQRPKRARLSQFFHSRVIDPLLNAVASLQNLQHAEETQTLPKKNIIRLPPHAIKLAPFLFNPKELIRLKVLLTGTKGEITAGARIDNGKIVESKSDNQPGVISMRVNVISAVLGVLIIGVIGAFQGDYSKGGLYTYYSILFLLALLPVMTFVITLAFLVLELPRILKNGVRFEW